MQHSVRRQAQNVNQVLQELLLKTRDELNNYYSKNKNQLPPILQSKNIFMLNLIQQEETVNQRIFPGKNSHSQHQALEIKYKKEPKIAISSTANLSPRPAKLYFQLAQPTKLRKQEDGLISSPFAKKTDKNRQKLQMPTHEMSQEVRFRLKDINHNSLHFQKHSQSLVHLIQKMDRKRRITSLIDQELVPVKLSDAGGEAVQPITIKTSSLQKIDKNNSSLIFLDKNLQEKIDDGMMSKRQALRRQGDKNGLKIEEYNFQTKRKPKIAPLQSSLRLKEGSFELKTERTVVETQLQPWNSQLPNDFDMAPMFLK